nr:Mut7-C RNAse domain-containing protein [Halobaculum sp. DT55]
MLGTLASYLRMCGYDTVYALDRGVEDDDALRGLAASDARRLITRDRALAASTPGAIRLDARDVVDQLGELRDAGVRLRLADRPSRCGSCNGLVERVDDDAPRPDYAPDEGAVWRCRECGQHFWRGSHWDDVADTLASLSRADR